MAAVDDHGVADHEGGRVRAQPDDGRGDLLGLAHPPDRLLRDHLRAPFGRAPGEAIHHRRVDVAGADGVDADVLRGVVEGRRLGEADHAVLRGGVRGAALDADDPCARGRVDDRAAALLEDQRNLVLHAQEDAAEVDVDDPVPLLLVVLRGRSRLPRLDARVVEGEVQPPESLNGLGQGRLHVLGPRHVAPDGERPPALLLDQAGRLLVALLGHVGGHHAGPLAGERQRRRAADAARGPGHERDLSRETPVPVRRHCLAPFHVAHPELSSALAAQTASAAEPSPRLSGRPEARRFKPRVRLPLAAGMRPDADSCSAHGSSISLHPTSSRHGSLHSR